VARLHQTAAYAYALECCNSDHTTLGVCASVERQKLKCEFESYGQRRDVDSPESRSWSTRACRRPYRPTRCASSSGAAKTSMGGPKGSKRGLDLVLRKASGPPPSSRGRAVLSSALEHRALNSTRTTRIVARWTNVVVVVVVVVVGGGGGGGENFFVVGCASALSTPRAQAVRCAWCACAPSPRWATSCGELNGNGARRPARRPALHSFPRAACRNSNATTRVAATPTSTVVPPPSPTHSSPSPSLPARRSAFSFPQRRLPSASSSRPVGRSL